MIIINNCNHLMYIICTLGDYNVYLSTIGQAMKKVSDMSPKSTSIRMDAHLEAIR